MQIQQRIHGAKRSQSRDRYNKKFLKNHRIDINTLWSSTPMEAQGMPGQAFGRRGKSCILQWGSGLLEGVCQDGAIAVLDVPSLG
jgi:hypothetical protein